MLNRLLLDPQAFAAKAESLRGSVLLSDLDQRVYTDDIADQNAELHYEISGGTDKW